MNEISPKSQTGSVTPPPRKTLGWFLKSQVRRWLSFHREMIHGIWVRVMLRQSGDRFSSIYNTSSSLRGSDAHTWFDSETGRTYVASGGHTVEAYPQVRALNYAKGIPARAEQMGRDYLLHLVDFADGDVIVDCGANVGDLKLYFRHLGVNVEYIAIEPGVGEFGVCERNVAPSEAHNVGLWNEDGELTFYVSSDGADSSLIEPPVYDRVVKVATKRLDGLLGPKRIKLLKLEAEGAEPEALEGAEGLFSGLEYIAADLGAERGKEQISTLPHVTNYLLARGFELIAVDHRRVSALYRNCKLA